MGEQIDPDDILEILHEMVRGRNSFLSDRTIRSIPFLYRSPLISRYMQNESRFTELISHMYVNNLNRTVAAQTLITLSFPDPMPSGFTDAVIVRPNQQQLQSSLQDCPPTTSSCAVCQEVLSSGACVIRQCAHVFHRSCIENWFLMSVRCPVCRYDIREANQASQTSSGAAQMSSQPTGPSQAPGTSV
jgi:hypothetical protein